MKKLALTGAVASVIMLMTACSDDNSMMQQPTADGNVTFSVSLPAELGSRAFADGLTAENLKVAVFDSESKALVGEVTEYTFSNSLSTTVSLNLANGNAYSIAFFAHNAADGVYTFDSTDKQVKVDYTKMTNHNAADYDCFFYVENTGVINSPIAKSITLNRPVAQINWGTSDINAASVTGDNMYGADASKLVSKVTIENAYTAFDMLTGDVVEDATAEKVELPYLSRPDNNENSFPVNADGTAFEYLSALYILAPQSANAVVDLTLDVANDKDATSPKTTVKVTNAPYQANFRTNIYGALLTNPADYDVSKDDEFGGSYDKKIWNGDIKEPAADTEGNYAISTAAELAGLAQLVNNGNALEGKTITLTTDIDLNNLDWTPIGIDNTGNKANTFKGTFDGQNHMIKNLKIDLAGKPSVYAGLFGMAWGCKELKNLTLDGVNINTIGSIGGGKACGGLLGSGNTAGITNVTVKNAVIRSYRQSGGIVGSHYGNVTDCHAENVDIELSFEPVSNGFDNADKAGAIIGTECEGQYTLENNTAENVKITGYRHIGGLFGFINYANIEGGKVYRNNTIANSTISQILDHNYNNIQPGTLIGEIVGEACNGGSYYLPTDGGGNVATNVNINRPVSSSDLAAGGNVEVKVAMEELIIPAETDENLTLSLTAPVGKITFPASNNNAISIEIGKDIDYPAFEFTSGSTVKDLTIKGDPESKKSFNGFVFHNHGGSDDITNTVKPQLLENLTLENLHFDRTGFIPQYTVSTKNTVIRNCVFTNQIQPAVAIQHAQGGGNETAIGITIEGCTIEFASDIASGKNGLYLQDVQGQVIVTNNTIKGCSSHGVFVASNVPSANEERAYASDIEISGNTITGHTRDGIKIENETQAAITISGNTIAVTENAVRVKNSLDGNTLVLTNNSIDMQNAISWNENEKEPSGLLLFNASENTEAAKITITGNIFKNAEHPINIVNVKQTDDSTVQETTGK